MKTLSRYSKWLPAGAILIIALILAFAINRYQPTLQQRETFTDTTTPISSSQSQPEEQQPEYTNEQITAMRTEQEQYLLEQIQADPNKTTLDREVMEDLTRQYFSASNTLPLLRAFNKQTQDANPVPGDQLIRDILRNYNKTA